MEINERIKLVLKKYGWTRYKLAKKGDIPESTLNNIFNRGTMPTIATIELICKTLNISLADFFADDERREMTPEIKRFYELW